MALNHTNTGADQRKSWDRTLALTRTTHGPLKSEYSRLAAAAPLDHARIAYVEGWDSCSESRLMRPSYRGGMSFMTEMAVLVRWIPSIARIWLVIR